MKKLTFVIAMLFVFETNAQNYLLDFAGTGASNTVESVLVENLNSGQSLTLNGTDILHLTGTTGLNPVANKQFSEIKIFPNPMATNSIIQIFPPEAGNAVITVLDITGKIVAQVQYKLENSLQEFRLSGILAGSYLISVEGKAYKYYAKLLCSGQANGTTSIEKIRTDLKFKKSDYKSTQATVDMAYTDGDRLKITGISGIYSLLKTDIPVASKTIIFNFIACTDGDNNNYPMVEIGKQVWMAENLKTTKYNDGADILLVTNNADWSNLTTQGYCWYNNNETYFKPLYGAIYNWYVVNTGNLCPTGLHVPAIAEWDTLENYLITNGYNYDGTTIGNKIAKAMASTRLWYPVSSPGAVGNSDYRVKRNATGFSALPCSGRGTSGYYDGAGSYGIWWSSTDTDVTWAWSVQLMSGYSNEMKGNSQKQNGFSVRCVKDN
jgi:uncharacterized protein (TIGR02145 family)